MNASRIYTPSGVLPIIVCVEQLFIKLVPQKHKLKTSIYCLNDNYKYT